MQTAARANQLSLFYFDESGFSNIPNVQSAWAPKGKPHTADAGVSRHRVNGVGALDFATGELWYDLHPPSVNRSAVVNLIDRIAKRPQPMPLTIVVLDNASTHHHIDQAKLDEPISLCWPSKNCRKLMTVAGLGQKRRLTQWVNWNLSKTRW